jgi:N-acetyl-gamma-glutamyl-phosphate reductase
MLKVGIIGASGYTGIELIRLLAAHPEAEIETITSRTYAGRKIAEVHPHLAGVLDLKFENVNAKDLAKKCDAVFTAVPHGTAMEYVPELIKGGAKVLDLSADYRLPAKVFESVYGIRHKDPRKAVYGLTELHQEVKDAEVVANPGCYPTGCVLAAAPLVAAGNVESVVFDCKSGISGAGAKPTETSHFPNLAENIIPYEITTHRHVPEIQQELDRYSKVKVSFTPHVIPVIRGILTTAHVFVKKKMTEEEVRKTYEKFYRGKKFIRLTDTPSLASVRGSNFCDIGLRVEKNSKRVVVLSAIDNLVKGAGGQAIQNMNLMFGLDETAGLWSSGIP